MMTIDEVPLPYRQQFVEMSLHMKARGHHQMSARAIMDLIRWETIVPVRITSAHNNWSPALARWAMAEHPELQGFYPIKDCALDDADDGQLDLFR